MKNDAERRRASLTKEGSAVTLSVEWATSERDVQAAQALRFRVFYEELSALACPAVRRTRRDCDEFDAICDHLLVVDSAPETCPDLMTDGGMVVGTYRLLRQDAACRHNGFYADGQFDLTGLVAAKPHLQFLEMGRSCVLGSHRAGPVIELLWRGIADYVRSHRPDVLIGCASLPGTDPDRLAPQLSLLAHRFMAADDWRAEARGQWPVEMDRLPRGRYDERKALAMLPPLVKGYLRAGARIAAGAVADHQFNTTDVLIVLPLSGLKPRYSNHFGVHSPAGTPPLSH